MNKTNLIFYENYDKNEKKFCKIYNLNFDNFKHRENIYIQPYFFNKKKNNYTIDCLFVSEWRPGFTQNLRQVITIIFLSLFYNIKEIYMLYKPNHIKFEIFDDYDLDYTISPISDVIEDKNVLIGDFYNFFSVIKKDIELIRLFDNFKNVVYKKLSKYYINTDKNVEKKSLAIHIRSGDIYRYKGVVKNKSIHPDYDQPKLDYYKKIINNNIETNKLYLVSEDYDNPIIHNLVDFLEKKHIDYELLVKNSLLYDFGFLINCETVVVGRGAFGWTVYNMSEKLKNFYYYTNDETDNFDVMNYKNDKVIENLYQCYSEKNDIIIKKK